MGYSSDISNIPHLQLDDQKDLLFYAMKIVPGDQKDFIKEYSRILEGRKQNTNSKKTSKKHRERRRGRKTRKKNKKGKGKKKSKKYSKNKHLSNKGSASSSFLPIVVLNSDTKTEKDSRVSKSETSRKRYRRKRKRTRPELYDRDYYDEYFYDYPPPLSSSWYRHRRTIPRFRPRHGYGIESSTSEDHYRSVAVTRGEKQDQKNR